MATASESHRSSDEAPTFKKWPPRLTEPRSHLRLPKNGLHSPNQGLPEASKSSTDLANPSSDLSDFEVEKLSWHGELFSFSLKVKFSFCLKLRANG
ncbi:hypothetical protein COLO4_07035 [Corchorus olitorius]|uniref:Uncharacterized protein n=1 Tax=Corchorus olitorius TaxID=93759 RepID=A0A1R3KL40_9ROSI|nr:hypothetical protein COLO4_07035 [Corchorus olitorius]